MIWQCRNRSFDFSKRALVMGILNVTPDSFSDGDKYFDAEAAIVRAVELAVEGADILDIGGESSRPGAESVSADEELRRVIPVIRELRKRVDVAISIDTVKLEVAHAALEAGADIINDISALRNSPEIARLATDSGAGVVLMHMLGTPGTMQIAPEYRDAPGEIRDFLCERMAWATRQGIQLDHIALDPGVGFGKRFEDNLTILNRLNELASIGRPLLVGVSRKSFIRRILTSDFGETSIDPKMLDEASLAVAVYSITRGANMIRVHHVAAARRAVGLIERLEHGQSS